MAKFQKKQQEEETSGVPRDTGKCYAYGCPLPAGMSHQTGGATDWVCQIHFRASISSWQEATHRINRDMTVVNLIRELRQSQNGKPTDIRGWLISLQNQGRDELLPCDADRRQNGTLSMRRWLGRIESNFHKVVTLNLDEFHEESTIKSNPEQIMAMADSFLKEHRMAAA